MLFMIIVQYHARTIDSDEPLIVNCFFGSADIFNAASGQQGFCVPDPVSSHDPDCNEYDDKQQKHTHYPQ